MAEIGHSSRKKSKPDPCLKSGPTPKKSFWTSIPMTLMPSSATKATPRPPPNILLKGVLGLLPEPQNNLQIYKILFQIPTPNKKPPKPPDLDWNQVMSLKNLPRHRHAVSPFQIRGSLPNPFSKWIQKLPACSFSCCCRIRFTSWMGEIFCQCLHQPTTHWKNGIQALTTEWKPLQRTRCDNLYYNICRKHYIKFPIFIYSDDSLN